MSILDRYLARSYLSGFAILMTVGLGAYVLIAMLLTLDEFTEDRTLSIGQVLWLIVDFYGHNIPMYFSQLAGPMMCVAATFTLGRLLRNNEMTAIIAAGVPLQRLVAPLMLCSLGLIALWVVNREVIIPAFAAQIARTPDDLTGASTRGVYSVRDERNAVLTALELDAHRGVLRRIFIVEPDEASRPVALITADEATYDPAARRWRLERGVRTSLTDTSRETGLGAGAAPQPIDSFAYGLTPDELLMRGRSQWADMIGWTELNTLARAPNLPNRPVIEMSRHTRLAQPLLQIVLLLLTVPWFLQREPTNVLAAGGKALVASAALFLVAFVAQGFSLDVTLAPLLAWLPILIFGPIAMLLVANVRT